MAQTRTEMDQTDSDIFVASRRFCREARGPALWSLYQPHFSPERKKLEKSSQKVWYYGNVYHHYAYDFSRKLKSYLGSLLRYGNPDWQFLGILKNKLQIYQKYGYSYYKFVARGHFRGAKRWKTGKNGGCMLTQNRHEFKIFPPFGTPEMALATNLQ